MKALTVKQPWAWAIINGGKDVENRTTAWKYRGPLAIHAGMQMSQRGLESHLIQQTAKTADPERPVVLDTLGKIWRHEESLPLGAIIGVVELVDVHVAEQALNDDGFYVPGCCDSEWAEVEYYEASGRKRRQLTHLVLERPRALVNPISCRGALGLWDVPADVIAAMDVTS